MCSGSQDVEHSVQLCKRKKTLAQHVIACKLTKRHDIGCGGAQKKQHVRCNFNWSSNTTPSDGKRLAKRQDD